MVILGINPGYDSTAAVLVDGKIGAIVEEERLSRVKNHLGFPLRAIPEALRVAGVKAKDVTLTTFSFVEYLYANKLLTELLLRDGGLPFDPENPLKISKVARELLKGAKIKDLLGLSVAKTSRANYTSNRQRYTEVLNSMGIPATSVLPVDHHLSHAASAYYSSGFDECLIVTSDGSGDGLSATASIGRGGTIQRLQQTPQIFSAGLFYGSITAYLGFKAHRHEGKITGLAAYGNPEACYEQLVPCLSADAKDGFSCAIRETSFTSRIGHMLKVFGNDYYRHPLVNDYQNYFARHLRSFSKEDIASAAQKRLEDVFQDYLAPILKKTGMKRVALAGGVFANVKLNQRIFEMDGVEEIYIHPNMGDGGNALGSAFVAYRKKQEDRRRPPYLGKRIEHVYLGPGYSDREIELELRKRNLKYTFHQDIETLIGRQVAEGKIVGRFNGRMEYGPRALGNRTILAHPGNAEINKTLNDRLHRTEFMPFAPSVLEEDAADYFHLSRGDSFPAEFMTITCNVRKEQIARIPAVSHVDGTARPHIVKASVNPSYHQIISAFKQHSGLGVIINTSFNIHEEPIVCSPADACRALQMNAVDYLAIGRFWVAA